MAGSSKPSGNDRDRRRRERDFRRRYAAKNGGLSTGRGSNDAYRRWTGYVLIASGALVAVSHLATHANAFGLRPTALEDVLVGYPAAFVLAIFGAMLLPATGRRR